MAGTNFTVEAAKRIAAVVRRVEQTPLNLRGDAAPTYTPDTSFWAYTSGCDITGKRYSWIKVVPVQGSDISAFTILQNDNLWTFADPTIAGTENACEVNGTRGIDPGTIVRLTFSGYNADGTPRYMFGYTPPAPDVSLIPHDHRDNAPNSGGFAFAVFHPGTALPQMNWGV